MRRKTNFLAFLFIFSSFLIGCVPTSGAGDRIISIKDSYTFNYSSIDSQGSSISDGGNITAVFDDVTKINWNDEYIVAEQTDFEGSLFNNKDATFKFNHPIETYKGKAYWILDMEKKEKYGPLRKDEYDQKKKELDIHLQLIKDKERAAGIPETFDVE